eukprot:42516_1
MPKVFGGVEAFETAILIIALVVIGRVDPETTHSKPNDLDLFITFWLVPFISYIFWIFVHIGYVLFGDKNSSSRCDCSTVWWFCIGVTSLCFLCCNPTNKGIASKALKSLKFRRWISIAYYTSSYFWIQVGYHRKHALGLISTEL